MKRKFYLIVLFSILALVLLVKVIIVVVAEPCIKDQIVKNINKGNKYEIEINKVQISIVRSELVLDGIKIISVKKQEDKSLITGNIERINITGIRIFKLLFKKDISVRNIIISNSRFNGRIPFPKGENQVRFSPSNIQIEQLFLDNSEISIGDINSRQTYSVKKGVLKFYDLKVEKQDTLSTAIISKFDFESEEITSVSSDSMYTFKILGLNYQASSQFLSLDSIFIQPNYSDYDFLSRYKYQTDRIEGWLKDVSFQDFSASDYIHNRDFKSSYIEAGEVKMRIFRDLRKEFRHVNKTAFQDIIYNYPGKLDIDTLKFKNGNVTYSEHEEDSNEAGFIRFNELKANIYKITNDSVYKKEEAYFEFMGEALLMGKGEISMLLKARLFDSQNTFTLTGKLGGMDVNELNPFLEKNEFIHISSGRIEEMNFSFTADNTKATGEMLLLYQDLKLRFITKETKKTTAIKDRFMSFIINIKVKSSNPLPGKEVRTGIIDYERDPERFLLNYSFKSMLTGIKSTLL